MTINKSYLVCLIICVVLGCTDKPSKIAGDFLFHRRELLTPDQKEFLSKLKRENGDHLGRSDGNCKN
jgi:hypothetical protein